MTSKTVDVDLRIRAKNLSKATLKEIEADVDRLTKAQKEQASAANLAAKSAKELAAQQQFLAAAERELSRRSNLGAKYKDEQEQIKILAGRIRELTAEREKAAAAGAKGGVLGATDREIARTNKAMDSLSQKNEQTGQSLRALGVDVTALDSDLGKLEQATAAAARAKQQAIADIQRHSAAQEQNNAVIAEATRRQREEAQVAARRNTAATQIAVETRNRQTYLDALRREITASLELGRQKEIEAEAGRRLQAETASEIATRQRLITTVVAEKNRREELAALRRDIIARSSQQNAVEERSNRIAAESSARRDRLIRLLQTERGQKIQAAEATRRETQAVEGNTAAKGRNASATDRASAAQKLFNDRGRESLSTYQRVRGQLLSIVAAYVGVYEAINTVQKAVEATNRDQSLRIGLRIGAEGNEAVAAKNYEMLRKEADRLGLVFDTVAPKFVNLDIAGQKAGLSANQTAEAFRNLSTAAAARNLSLDDTEGAFRAIEQMFSKGKVQAEELRGQLAERLPGAVAIFAQASGKSLSELDKDLEQGRIGLDFVVRGLRAYAQQFDGEMGNLTERLSAYINRAKNAYNDWLRTLMSGENQERLKRALSAITDFFQGEQGANFAKALGEAFAAAAETVIWLAKNIETVTTVIKLFIGVQILKFLADIVVSLKAASAGFLAFRAQAALAATSTGAMGTAARGLTVAMGPVGVALAALTAGFFAYQAAVDAAEARTQKFINTLDKSRRAQGVGELAKSGRELSDALDESNAKLGELVRTRDNVTSFNPLKAGKAAITAYSNDLYTLEELNLAIVNEQQKQAAIQQAQINLQKRMNTAVAEEADARKKLAEEPIVSSATTKAAKTPKAAAGPDPDSVRDRVLKMTQDLTAKIAQTEIQANARTMDQIEQNYQSRLAVIKTEVEKAEIEIAAIQRAAGKSNKGAGTDISNELTTLKGALETYQLAAEERAKEDKTVASIQLREQELQKLIDERAAKLELINTLQQTGAITVGEAWSNAFRTNEEYNVRIREQIDGFMQMLQAVPPDSDLYARLGVAKLITGLQQARAEAAKTQSAVKQIGQVLAQDVAAGGADALVTLGKGLAGAIQGANSLGDAFKGAMDNFRTFAADFLQRISQMILQAILLQALQNAINGTSGGYGGAIMSAFGTRHQGGIAGGPSGSNPTRTVSPLVFAGAPRLHDGGIAGLKPNEIPTILERGEEVVTADSPRHVNNYEGGGGASPVTVINQFESTAVVGDALARPEGRRTLLAFVNNNRQAFKAAMGN